MSATSPVETAYKDLVLVDVIGRSLFYNNSSFDGNNAAVNAADDAAIASDKSALLPGGTATFANYSSYSRGINGLMIDIAGLPSASLASGDFQFRVGNVNDPSTWIAAPAPATIVVRVGAGTSGSSRVEVVWADGAIKNQWLEVTVKATPDTGLLADDTFYFGNAVGETGNSAADAIVDILDVQGVQANPRGVGNPAPITFAYDFNRDGLVDATDQSLAANNATTAGTALKLLQPPAINAEPRPERLQTSLFNWGDIGIPVITIPAIVTLNDGSILAFAEARADRQDKYAYGILMRKSTDGGVSWSAPKMIYNVTPRTGVLVAQATPVVDRITGDVILLMSNGTINPVSEQAEYSDVLMTRSSDGGNSWAPVTNITSQIKVTADNNPGPPGVWPDDPWGWIIVGAGHGIQLQHGPNAGRLVVGGDHRLTTDNTGESWSHVIYSDDHGMTWHLGGGLVGDASGNHQNDSSNEATLVELSDGSIYMSSRINLPDVHSRGASVSTDGGLTFSPMTLETDLGSYQVHGSLLRLNDDVLLFSSPRSVDDNDTVRHEMTIWLSYDDGETWTRRRTIFFGYSGYSDMTVVGPDTVLLTFNRGWTGGLLPGDSGINATEFYQEVGLARVNLRFLESDEPYEFTWHFNDKPIGGIASYNGSSIADYGYWDQRAMARASSPAQGATYVPGPSGDAALELTGVAGSSGVVLSQAYNYAMQIGPNDSFTVQLEMKTSDTSGVIIGTRPTIRNWTLEIVNGKLRFSLFDTQNTAEIISDAVVADGQWHHIAAVRDATNRTLRIYIDHVEAATAVVDTATYVRPSNAPADPIDPVYLGTYNNLQTASKLALTVDTLKFTRAALTPGAFFDANDAVPAPPPPPTYLPNNPTTIDGLLFWLPAYDPTRFFSDQNGFANPLPLVPFEGMATRSMQEASSNGITLQTFNPNRQVQYAYDDVIGPYWKHVATPQAAFGSELLVRHQSGSKTPVSFDFIQNTGVFTLSTFLKLGASTQNNRTLFDTNEGSANRAGFSLMVQQNGLLFLSISGGTGNARFNANAPAGSVMVQDQWYHVAVVGNGPNNPIKFYVTNVANNTVTVFDSTQLLVGENGTYTTDFLHELFIAGRSNKSQSGAAPFNGGLVNEAIYNRALSQDEIQQLFLFGKGLTSAGPAWQNPTNSLDVDNNGAVDARDVLFVANYVLLHPGGELPTGSPPPYLDVNGSDSITAIDALQVINWVLLNPPGAQPATAQAQSDATPTATPAAMADEEVVFATLAIESSSLDASPTNAAAIGSFAAAATSGPATVVTFAPMPLDRSIDSSTADDGTAYAAPAADACHAPREQDSARAADRYFAALARHDDEQQDSCDFEPPLATLRRAARSRRTA